MHELACPSCNATSPYELSDYLLLCPYCSTAFNYDRGSGQKEMFSDHYIVPNIADPMKIKDMVTEWLKRIHHNPGQVAQEYAVVEIHGVSIPYWVVSLQGHTYWKGMVKRQHAHRFEMGAGSNFIIESNQFHRSYRWCISARHNLFETWGLQQLHEPKEDIVPEWDGFPLDSTFSRGRLTQRENEKTINDAKEFFEFKYANGLPILGIQVSREEALRRAKDHVQRYHYRLAQIYVDRLVDYNSELEIAGIQLVHLPFWHARYVYQPRTILRHMIKPTPKNVMIDGYGLGVLRGELPIIYREKLMVNVLVCATASFLMGLLGFFWHPAFFLVTLFGAFVTAATWYMAGARSKNATLVNPEQGKDPRLASQGAS
jgi:hypothetical protein